MSSAGGFLYAIGAEETPLVKIGYAKNVAARLKTLQTGQPFVLRLLASLPVETDAARIERKVHAFLAQDRRRGEWFEVAMNEDMLAALIVRAIAALEDDLIPRPEPHWQPSQVPQNVKAYRLAAKLTLAQMSGRAHLPVSTLSKIENGSRSLRIDELPLFAEALDCTIYDLLGNLSPQASGTTDEVTHV